MVNNLYTKQECFDIAYLGCAGQGFTQSVTTSDTKSCLYRSPDGKKCAAGHILPDDEFDKLPPNLNYAKVYNIPWFAKNFDIDMMLFLRELQYCHDNGFTPETMQQKFVAWAAWVGLVVPELPNE